MKNTPRVHSFSQYVSVVFMTVALLWLTVSLPVVYAAQKQFAELSRMAHELPASADEDVNPFGNNTTEEKTPNSISLSEEYLHHHHKDDLFFLLTSLSHNSENAGTYIAFHGELLVPPPNFHIA